MIKELLDVPFETVKNNMVGYFQVPYVSTKTLLLHFRPLVLEFPACRQN
jgi:hypothetical protein